MVQNNIKLCLCFFANYEIKFVFLFYKNKELKMLMLRQKDILLTSLMRSSKRRILNMTCRCWGKSPESKDINEKTKQKNMRNIEDLYFILLVFL